MCFQSCKAITAVERQVRISPSSRAANIEVFYVDEDNKTVQIKPGMDIYGVAGEMITGISEYIQSRDQQILFLAASHPVSKGQDVAKTWNSRICDLITRGSFLPTPGN